MLPLLLSPNPFVMPVPPHRDPSKPSKSSPSKSSKTSMARLAIKTKPTKTGLDSNNHRFAADPAGTTLHVVIDSGATKHVFDQRLLYDCVPHVEQLQGLAADPIESVCKGKIKLALYNSNQAETTAVVIVEAWGIEVSDVADDFESLISLASVAASSVTFAHYPESGPYLDFDRVDRVGGPLLWLEPSYLLTATVLNTGARRYGKPSRRSQPGNS
jgi:hypothetical protein